MSNSEFGNLPFDLPKNQSNVIKVIGVGGGGSNAINHMFKQGIKGVDFIVCNTDAQALENSPVPNKIQLGVSLTEGLGAGANPDIGQQSAIESMLVIEKMLDTNTKMIFITAGMGGGTGTGAAPVIAQLAKERDILTVGIVTIPFQFEGKVRTQQALAGIDKLRKQVDSLIVVNNNKLREVYGNLGFKAGFSKADEVLATASRGIAEVITHHYTQNIDLKDVKTVLANSGSAIMGSGVASGETRAKDAIMAALDSPLLNDNKITGAKNVLLLIVYGSNEITIDEISEISEYIQNEAGHNANIIMGAGEDEARVQGDSISVTIIATGFNVEQQNEIVNTEPKKIIHSLEDEQKLVHDLSQKPLVNQHSAPLNNVNTTSEKIVFELLQENDAQIKSTTSENELLVMNEFIRNLDVTFEIVSPINSTEFEILQPQKPEVKAVQPQIIEATQPNLFLFDLPIVSKPQQSNQAIEVQQLSEETKNIEVVAPIQFVPVTEQSDTGIIRYSLEEYMEIENELLAPVAVTKPTEEPIAAELNLTIKKIDEEVKYDLNQSLNNAPFEQTIEQTLKIRADERRKKLKDFNYKFSNNSAHIDQLERIPAYKRSGLDLNDNPHLNNQTSRLSVGNDSNNEVQLRSNNSYLHDNVD
jgi:cell division protein FtsZ